jgi:hypothetical protein
MARNETMAPQRGDSRIRGQLLHRRCVPPPVDVLLRPPPIREHALSPHQRIALYADTPGANIGGEAAGQLSQATENQRFLEAGVPYGIRTRVAAVRGRFPS